MIGYEFEYFNFLLIAVLFSAGNAKKNVFTIFIDPIVTIDGFKQLRFNIRTGRTTARFFILRTGLTTAKYKNETQYVR